jgi:hypothetical protein
MLASVVGVDCDKALRQASVVPLTYPNPAKLTKESSKKKYIDFQLQLLGKI